MSSLIDAGLWIDHLEHHLPVARAGREPEGVHQVRVATRRLQSFLRLSGRKVLLSDLRWVRSVMGAARDLDVLIASRPGPAFRQHLLAERRAARKAVRSVIDDPRCRALLLALRAVPPLDSAAAFPRLRRDLERVLGDGERFEADPLDAEALHTLRRHAKGLRYALDWLSIQRSGLKPLQEALGSSNDAWVALEHFHRWPGHLDDPETASRIGTRLADARQAALVAWRTARLDLAL